MLKNLAEVIVNGKSLGISLEKNLSVLILQSALKPGANTVSGKKGYKPLGKNRF